MHEVCPTTNLGVFSLVTFLGIDFVDHRLTPFRGDKT
jgi:hypothetical protein